MQTSSLMYGAVALAMLAGCACPPKAIEPVAATEQPKVVAPAPMPGPQPQPVAIIPKGSIYFDYDKSDIKTAYRQVIETHADFLKAHPNASAMVEGNTDERGSNEYNLALGQRRADAVKNALLVLGVKDSQLESVSYGKEKPRASGSDAAAYAENRRDDIDYDRK